MHSPNLSHEAFIDLLLKEREQLPYFPGRVSAANFIHQIFSLLFICRTPSPCSKEELLIQYEQIKIELEQLIQATVKNNELATSHTRRFMETLPTIYQCLREDADAIYTFDPAATSIMEVMATYPGFYAITVHRVAHQLWMQKLPYLPRLLAEIAHSETGIDIHPGATIGSAFAIDHGTGIVIGETSVIGNGVKIYQGVTLGAINVSKEYAQTKRHPTVEDNVVIYSGATILGGDTVIGHDSIIGGNVWVTHSTPPKSVVYHKSEVKVKGKEPFEEPINFII
ncbi:serine O-acetyltransferase EpsC [Flavisolibacter tropicus]|uniref:Serine acetyltransferase n=1 Tax=Flavisolibacter tropicus TaxID=1492898 RepID=A0A172U140_9BACT|nr:serine O-acetyltransferase EpsC [Flavisolibacter tropicus]ANE52743.1 serine acetyltransferase [Flavisolibacter tropicus]